MRNYIHSKALNNFPEIAHFCTTRYGGTSVGNYASFNMSSFTGDKTENLQQNIHLLSKNLEIPTDRIIYPFQSHGSEIRIIDADFFNYHPHQQSKLLYNVDALITDQPNVCIGVTTADCVPLTFFDPIHKVIAVAHAGWRGTCARIAQKTITEMQINFGSEPKDIFVLIGPSISSVAYNVGEDVYASFKNENFPVSKVFIKKEGQLFLDLWTANSWLLESSGIPTAQIEVSGICTHTNHNEFFSARRLGIKSGRMLSGIFLK